jgi:ferredoxin
MKIMVNKKKCDTCGTCISVCPNDAMIIIKKLEIDPVKCSTCSRCVKICPEGALELKK